MYVPLLRLEKITLRPHTCSESDTEDLTLPTNQENEQPLNEKPQIAAEICCPICFEEMTPPKQILCCTNGNLVLHTCILAPQTMGGH